MTDHSEMMGMASQALDENSAVYSTLTGRLLRAVKRVRDFPWRFGSFPEFPVDLRRLLYGHSRRIILTTRDGAESHG